MSYLIVKWLHVLSSTLLFGTGLGTAYFMFFASRTRDPRVVASVLGMGVMADWLFTATTLVFQPLSGWYLAHRIGLPLTTGWVLWSILLFLLAGACWLPVVWLQIQMRDMARRAVSASQPLPAAYFRHLMAWVVLGIPAFVSLVLVFYLMVVKPG